MESQDNNSLIGRDSDAEIEYLTNRNRELEDELADAKKEIQLLNEQETKLRKFLVERRNQLEQADTTLATLRNTIAGLKTEIRNSNSLNEGLVTTIKEFDAEVERLRPFKCFTQEFFDLAASQSKGRDMRPEDECAELYHTAQLLLGDN